MIILGLDPSLSSTGYSIIQSTNDCLTLLDSGIIRTKSSQLISTRLHTIGEQIEKIINTHHPEQAVLEECFLGQNVRTALLLGEVRGALLIILKKLNILTFGYSAKTVKLAIVGYGAASKTQVQWMIKKILCLSDAPISHDATDAMAVAICHIHHKQPGSEKRI